MHRPYWLVAVGLLLAGSSPGCSTTTPEPFPLVLTGSEEMVPLVREVGDRFEKGHPGVRVNLQGGGAERGVADVRSGLADVGMVARALRPDEAGLSSVAIARDGIGLLVHRNNPMSSLTDEQVVRLYTRVAPRWKQVGGEDRPVVVISHAEGRDLLTAFLEHLKLKVGQIRPDLTVPDSEQAIKAVAEQPQAIAVVSVGLAEAASAAGVPVRLLPLGGVAPTQATVADGSYPLTRPLNLVTREAPPEPTRNFLDFARSPEVHEVIRKYRYVPIP